MASIVRGLVSKKKLRYKENGFDLDLSYIFPRIIAMGFPASKLEAFYRNPIDEVARLLDGLHPDHYKVYNLCSERDYDVAKFHDRVERFPFHDHNPPPLSMMKAFCESIDAWLSRDDENVAVVHCKAGKGRTGVMICAYMLYRSLVFLPRKDAAQNMATAAARSPHQLESVVLDQNAEDVLETNIFSDADAALKHYGKQRTENGKGVTIPSQRRYVQYFFELLHRNLDYKPVELYLNRIEIETTSRFKPCSYQFTIHNFDLKISSPVSSRFHRRQGQYIMKLERPVTVCEDSKIEFFRVGRLYRTKMFQFWFNTFFMHEKVQGGSEKGDAIEYTMMLPKNQLDKIHSDETRELLSVTCYFSQKKSTDPPEVLNESNVRSVEVGEPDT